MWFLGKKCFEDQLIVSFTFKSRKWKRQIKKVIQHIYIKMKFKKTLYIQPVCEHPNWFLQNLGSVFAEQTDKIQQELKQPKSDFQICIFLKICISVQVFPN